jgi:ATP-dependent Clp protease, protease subunit
VTEDNRIETTSGADSRLSGYSSNNFKKSLDLAKKISDRNSDVGTNDNSQTSHVAEKSNHSERVGDIYSWLLKERIIFLGSLDSNTANSIAAQLLFLEAEDSEKDIYFYINSPGGSVSAGMVIFDAMNQILPDVCTVCIGFAGGMAGFLLSAGARGKRMSLPSSRMMLCQAMGHEVVEKVWWGTDISIQAEEMEILIQAREILYQKYRLNNLLAQHTGHPTEKVEEDTGRYFYMSAIEAKEYGLIDMVVDRPLSDSNPPIFA